MPMRRERCSTEQSASSAHICGGLMGSTHRHLRSSWIDREVLLWGERLSELERWRIAELSAQGWTTRLIAKEVGRGHGVVAKHLRLMRRPPVREPVRSALRLSLAEREEI